MTPTELSALVERLRELERERDDFKTAWELSTEDCRNLTEKVIPGIRTEWKAYRDASLDLTAQRDALKARVQELERRLAETQAESQRRWLLYLNN